LILVPVPSIHPAQSSNMHHWPSSVLIVVNSLPNHTMHHNHFPFMPSSMPKGQLSTKSYGAPQSISFHTVIFINLFQLPTNSYNALQSSLSIFVNFLLNVQCTIMVSLEQANQQSNFCVLSPSFHSLFISLHCCVIVRIRSGNGQLPAAPCGLGADCQAKD